MCEFNGAAAGSPVFYPSQKPWRLKTPGENRGGGKTHP